MEKELTITFICKESKGHDSYYEDEDSEYGREIHTIQKDTKIVNYVIPLSKIKDFYMDYQERNADNPPYDTYEIVLAFWTESKNPISLRSLEEYEDN